MTYSYIMYSNKKLGESVDDFVVRTHSKTDKIIRDYTAVASNAYKGISVLDANGNLRSTYSILLDISKIYKEIQAEDKAHGTNRAQALVETLAGKNRSNIASSILLNPSLLEDVKAKSANDFLGSADEELEKYLDSVEGKAQKLNNSLQELASLTFDSEWLKVWYEGLTGLLDVVKDIVKVSGGFNAGIGAIFGGLMTASKFNVVDFSKGIHLGQAGKLVANGAKGLANKAYTKFGGTDKLFYNTTKDNIINQLGSYAPDQSLKQALIEQAGVNDISEAFEQLTEEGQQILTPFWDKIADDSAKVSDVIISNANGIVEVVNTNSQKSLGVIKGLGSKAVTLFESVGSTIVNGLLSMGISVALSALATGILTLGKNIIFARDVAIEKGEEAKDEIKSIYDEIKEGQDQIKDLAIKVKIDDAETKTFKENITAIAEKWAELKQGVNDDNSNKSLSLEEYQEFLDISNHLAEKFPELVQGYDNQGNSILNLSDNVDLATDKLQTLYDISLDIANLDITKNLNDAFNGSVESLEKLTKEREKLDEKGEKLQTELQGYEIFDNGGYNLKFSSKEQYQKFYDEVKDKLKDVGDETVEDVLYYFQTQVGDLFDNYATSAQSGNLDTDFFIQNREAILNAYQRSINPDSKQQKEARKNLAENNKNKAYNERQQIREENKVREALTYGLQTDSIFRDMNGTLTNLIVSNLSQFNIADIEKQISEDTEMEDIVDWYIANIIEPLASIPDEQQAKLEEYLNDDHTGETFANYFNNIKEQIKDVTGGDETLADTIMKILGFDKLQDQNKDRISYIMGAMEGTGITEEYLNNLSQRDFDKAYNLVSSKSQTYQKYGLDRFLFDMNAKPKEENGTLSELFGDEQFKTKEETYVNGLNSLVEAIKSANENGGRLIGESQAKLQKEMMETDFGEFKVSDLQDVAIDNLNEYIRLLYEEADAVNLDADAMSKLDNYITALMNSYSDVINNDTISSDMVTSLYGQNLSNANLLDARSVEDFERIFADELADKEDRKILYSLVVNPDSANWTIQEWQEKYNDAKLNWKIYLDKTDFEKQMEQIDLELGYIDAKQSGNQATSEYKKENGLSNLDEINGQLGDNNQRIANIRAKQIGLYDPRNPNSLAAQIANNPELLTDADAFKKARETLRTQYQEYQNQIDEITRNNEKLEEEKLLLPVTILDANQISDVKQEYGELKRNLEQYGADTPVDLQVYVDFIAKGTENKTLQQQKVDLLNSLLDTEGISKSFKDQLTALRDEAIAEIDTLTEDINTYTEKSGVGNDQIQIANLKAQKAVYSARQSASGQKFTEEDYTNLNRYNAYIVKSYDNIIKEANAKMEELKDASDATSQAEYTKWQAIYRNAVTEQADFITEIAQNNTNIELLPITKLESDLEKLQESGTALKTIIDDLESSGTGTPDNIQLGKYASNLEQQYIVTQKLADQYKALYDSAPENTEQKDDYRRKYNQYNNALPGLRTSADQVYEKMDLKGIDALEAQMIRLRGEAEAFQDALDNADVPLTQKDYADQLKNVADRLSNATKQEEYWQKRLDNSKLPQHSKKYQEYEQKVRDASAEVRNLTKEQKNLTEAFNNIPFDQINNHLDWLKQELEDINLDLNVDIALGGVKDSKYFDKVSENIEDQRKSAEEGLEKASKKMGEEIGKLQLDPEHVFNVAVSNASQYRSKSPQDIISEQMDENHVDYKKVQTVSGYRRNFSNALKNTIIDESANNFDEINQTISNYENSTKEFTNEVSRLEGILSDSTHNATFDDYRNLIIASGQEYESMQNEYKYVDNQIKDLDEQGWDKNNQDYIKLNDTLTALSTSVETLKQKQEGWQISLKNLGVDKFSTKLADLNDQLDSVNENIDLKTDTGGEKSLDDYKAQDELYEQISDSATKYANTLRANMETLVQAGIIDVGSQAYEQMETQIKELEKQAETASHNLAQNLYEEFNLPEVRKARAIVWNDQEVASERNRITNMENAYQVVNSDEYRKILRKDYDSMDKQNSIYLAKATKRNNAIAKANNELKTSGVISDDTQIELLKANEEYYTAQSELYERQRQVAEDSVKASDAILAQFREQMRVISVEKEALQSDHQIDEAIGRDRTVGDIQADLQISTDSIEAAQNQLKDLDINDFKDSAMGILGIDPNTTTVLTEEQIKQINEVANRLYKERQKELNDTITSNTVDKYNYERELNERPVVDMENQLTNLETTLQGINTQMDGFIVKGEQIPDSLFKSYINESENLSKLLEDIASGYDDLADKAEARGDVQNARTYRSKAESYRQQNVSNEKDQNDKEADELAQELAPHQNAIRNKQIEARNRQNDMADTSRKTIEADYDFLIGNADDQIKELEAQKKSFNQRIEALKNDPEVAFTEDNVQYQEYLQNLNDIDEQIQQLIKSQKEWNKAKEELKINETNDQLEEYNRSLTKLNNNVSLNEAKGIKKTFDDYKKENEQLNNIVKDATAERDKLQKELDDKLFSEEIQKGSDDEKWYQSQIDSFDNQVSNASIQLANNLHDMEILGQNGAPGIDDFQKELDKLKLGDGVVKGYEDLKEEIDDIIASGGEVPESLYADLTSNIESQKTQLQGMKLLYQSLADLHKNDDFGLYYQGLVDDVDKQIDSLEDEEIEIDIELDQRSLNHLKRQLNDLGREGERLKTQLDATESISAKEGILNKIIANNKEQMKILAQNISEYRRLMNEVVEEYKNDNITDNDDNYVNDSRYIELKEQLDDAIDSTNTLVRSTTEYEKALQNLPIERINRNIEANDARLSLESSKRDLKEARGEAVTEDDYARSLTIAGNNVDQKTRALTEAEKDLADAQTTLDESWTYDNQEELRKAQIAYNQAQEELNNAEIAFLNTQDEAHDATMNLYKGKLQDLQSIGKKFQNTLSDDSIPKTAEMYEDAIQNAELQQENLNEQMAYTHNQMEGLDKSSSRYLRLQSTLEGLRDEYDGLAESVRNWHDAIEDLPLVEIEKRRQNNQIFSQQTSTQNDILSALGGQTDYSKVLHNDTEARKIAEDNFDFIQKKVEDYRQKYESRKGKLGENIAKQNYEEAVRAMLEAGNDVDASNLAIINDRLAQAKAPIDQLAVDMEKIKNQAKDVEAYVNLMVENGYVGTSEQYTELLELNSKQLSNIQSQKQEWESYRTVVQELIESEEPGLVGIGNTLLNSIDSALVQLDEDTRQLTKSTLEYNLMLNGGMQLKQLQDEMTTLEQMNTHMTEQLERQRNKGYAVQADDYQAMADNFASQIENLIKTNEILEQQQGTVGITKNKFDELTNSISTNESSINSLIEKYDEFNKHIVNFASEQAKQLKDVVSNAISESVSDTGLSNESIEALKGQFKQLEDISNIDLSSIFYESAEGIKVHTNELRNLINIQRNAFSQGMINNISRENDAIQKQTQVIDVNGQKIKYVDSETLKGHSQKMQALQDEIVQYNAIMNAIDQSLSSFSKWQEAENTQNEGATYDTIYSSLVEMENRRKKLLTGTDEFKAFTSMASPTGESGTNIFDMIYEPMTRYFTKGTEGLNNFLDDLVTNGFIKALGNGQYDIGLLDTSKISESLGISTEMVESILQRLNDYNFGIVYARDGLDANAKLIEKNNELEDAMFDKAQAIANNDQDALYRAEQAIERLKGDISALSQMKQTFGSTVFFSEDQYNTEKVMIGLLQEQLRDAKTDTEEYYRIRGQLAERASSIGATLNNDDTVSYIGYDNYLKQQEEIAQKLADSMPDLSDITSSKISEYKSGIEQLREIVGNGVNLDFKFDGATTEEIQQQLVNLQNIEIDATETPSAQSALDRLMQLTQTELHYKVLIDYTTKNGLASSPEELLQMDQQGNLQPLLQTMGLDTGEIDNLIQLIGNKVAQSPVTVKIDEESISQIRNALSDIEVDANLTEEQKQKLKTQLQTVFSTTELEGIDLNADTDTLINQIQSALDNKQFTINVKSNISRGPLPSSASSMNGTISSFANGTVKDGVVTKDQKALVNEAGTEGLIHDGVLTKIPGGMHIMNLKKGDGIVNSKQMKQLEETGHASGKAKIIGGENSLSSFWGGTNGASTLVSSGNVTGFDSTFDKSNANIEANRTVKTLLDGVQRAINEYTDGVQDVTDKIQEYLSSSDKRDLLIEKSNAILDSIVAHGEGAEAYMSQATKYRYIDNQGVEQVYDITQHQEELAQKGLTLDDLLTGSFDLENTRFDLNDENEKLLYEAIQNYQDMMDKAKNLSDALPSLRNELQGVYNEMIQLPFDELQKGLEKIGNTARGLNAMMSTASSGRSGIEALNTALHEVFGAEADQMLDTSGKDYEVLNRMLEQNIDLKKQEATLNKEALDNARADNASLKTQQLNMKSNIESGKQQLLNAGLSQEDYEKLLSGNTVDAKKYDGNKVLLDLLNVFNVYATQLMALNNALIDSEKKVASQFAQTQEAVAEYASALVNATGQALDNVNKYYSALSNYSGQLGSNAMAQADYTAQWLGYSNHSGEIYQGYQDAMARYQEQIAYTEANIAEQERILNEAVANGTIKQGSTEWLQYATAIEQAKGSLISLRSAMNEAYKKMADIPLQKLQERLKDIEYAYRGVTSAMSSGVAESMASINAYNQLASSLGVDSVFAGMSGGKAYQYQNALLQRDAEKSKAEAAEAVAAYREAQALYAMAVAEGDEAKIRLAKNAMYEARSLMDDKLMESAVKQVRQFEQAVKNIDNYYSNIVGHIDEFINGLKIAKQYMEAGNGYAVNGWAISDNIYAQIQNANQQRDVLAQDIAEMEAKLNEGVASGIIQVGDETWLSLDTQIMNTRNKMENLKLTTLQLYEELANVPNKVVEAKLKEIEWAFDSVTKALNANIASSRTALRVYREYAQSARMDVFSGIPDYIDAEYEYADYLRQNELQKLKQEVEVAMNGYAELRQRYENSPATEEERRMLREAMENAKSVLNDKIMEYASKVAQSFTDSFKDIETYYHNITGYDNSILESLKLQNELWQMQDGLIKNAEYSVEFYERMVTNTRGSIRELQRQLDEMEAELAGGLLSGDIVEGDQLYMKLSTSIQNTKNEMLQLRIEQRKFINDMLDVPAKKAEEMIKRINEAYSMLSSTASNNISDSASARMMMDRYTMPVSGAGNAETRSRWRIYGSDRLTYDYQNEDIDLNIKKEEEILEERKKQYETATMNARIVWNDAQAQEEANKKLSEAQVQLVEQQAKVASARVNGAVNKVKNIESYYKSILDYMAQTAEKMAEDRQYTEKYFGYIYSSDALNNYVDSYNEEISAYKDQQGTLAEGIKKAREQMEKSLDDGTIVYGDEKWREMDTIIKNMEKQMRQLQTTTLELFEQMLDVPNKQFEEKMKGIADAYSRLNSLIASNISQSASAVQMMSRLNLNTRDFGVDALSPVSGKNPYAGLYDLGAYEYQNQATDILKNIWQTDEQLGVAYENVRAYTQMYENFEGSEEERKIFRDKLIEAQNQYYEQEAKSVQMHVNAVKQFLDNIRNYYDSINSFVDSSTQIVIARRNNLVNYSGYTGNETKIAEMYYDPMRNYLEQQDNLMRSYYTQGAQLRQSVADGQIVEGSSDWNKAMTDINNTRKQIEDLKSSFLESMKEMLSLPSNIISEKIQDITDAYSGLTYAINSEILSMSGSQRIYANLIDTLSKKSNGLIAPSNQDYIIGRGETPNASVKKPAFVWQNQALVDDLQRQREETALYVQSAMAAQDIYNNLLRDQNVTQEELFVAEQNIKEATRQAQESIANLGKAESELLKSMVTNIESYYNRIHSFITQVNENISATNDLIVSGYGYIARYGTLTTNYTKNIENSRLEISAIISEIQTVNRQIQDGIDNNRIKPTDDEYIELNNELASLQNQLIQTAQSLNTLYEGFYNLPIEMATEKIEKLESAYKSLTLAINGSNLETIANQRVLRDVVNEYANLYDKIDATKSNFVLGETFVGQNASLLLNIQKTKAELDILAETVQTTGERLDGLKYVQPEPLYEYQIEAPEEEPIFEDGSEGLEALDTISQAQEQLFEDNADELTGLVADEWDDINSIYENEADNLVALNNDLMKQTQEQINFAQKSYDIATQNYLDKQNEYASLLVQYAKQSVANINTYYNSLISYQENLSSRFAETISVMEQLGKSMDKHGLLVTDTAKLTELYTNQIDALIEKQRLLATSIAEQENQLDKVKDTIGEDSEEYRDMESNIISLRNQFDEATISLDKLQDTMREELYIKPIQNVINELQTLRNSFATINSLIDQESKITEEGDYTEMGILSMTFDMESYYTSRAELEKAIEEYNIMNERWREDASYSDEQYLNDRKNAIQAIQNAMASTNTNQQAIMSAIKNRYRTEIDYIKKLIQAQSEQLSKQKELDDYDRNLKEKTNNVKRIERQIMALSALTDLESRSQKTRLEEQLRNAQDDLDNTVRDHVVQLRQEGLNKLSEQLDEKYEDYIKELALDFDKVSNIIKDTGNNLSDTIDRFNLALAYMLGGYSDNLTNDMALGINGLNLDLSQLASDDLYSTEQMEDEKAQKLQQYENAKIQVMSNLEQNQKDREQRIKDFLNTRWADEDVKDDATESHLNDIETSSSSIANNIDKITNNIIDTLASNLAIDNAVNSLSSSELAIKNAIEDYSKTDNPLFKVTTLAIKHLQEINKAVSEINSTKHLEEINQIAQDSVSSIPDITDVVQQLNREEDKYRYFDGKKYQLNSNGKLNFVSGTTNVKQDQEEVDPLHLPTGDYAIYYYDEGTDSVLVTTTKEIENDNGSHMFEESYRVSRQALLQQGKYVDIEGLKSVTQNGGYYTLGHYESTPYQSAYSQNDIINRNSLNTGSYTIGGTTKLDGKEYAVISGGTVIEGDDIMKALGKLLSVDELRQAGYGNVGKGSNIVIGSFNEALKFNEQGGIKTIQAQREQEELEKIRQYNQQLDNKSNQEQNDQLFDDSDKSGNFFKRYAGTYTVKKIERNGIKATNQETGHTYLFTNRNVGLYELPTSVGAKFVLDDKTKKARVIAYANGTLSAKKGLSIINDEGPETIVTKKGTFVPFTGGEGVVPAKQTASLIKMAEGLSNGALKLQIPDMSNYKPITNYTVANNSSMHFDSLITINGNADQNTVDQIRQIATELVNNKAFQENVTRFVNKRQAQDSRMAGKRLPVK